MLKVGIVGGGQLGRMLLQQAANYPIETFVLENDTQAPAAHLCHHFQLGSITDFDTVLQFGRKVDVLTIEIENVSVEALFQLEKEGVKVIPRPAVLQTIKDKGLQKQFYETHQIPSPEFVLLGSAKDLQQKLDFLPAAQKMRTGGYDGKGVQLLWNEGDMVKAFSEPSLLEKMVDIEKEIAVIVACNESGETAVFPPTEMVFDPQLNLVDYLIAPANLSEAQIAKAEELALQVCSAFASPGIFAVEMFLNKDAELLVNETAPRVHNSGHQSIEGNYVSQFDMLLRVLQNLPLGSTKTIKPALMLNVLGEDGFSGNAQYEGLPAVLQLEGVSVHLYGKKQTKPGRKMGHVTIIADNRRELLSKAAIVKNTLKVKS
ncbi:MAG: 5-(carboxyamino)imidazole ribonucleotide synthase [Chitinophagales bacterium]